MDRYFFRDDTPLDDDEYAYLDEEYTAVMKEREAEGYYERRRCFPEDYEEDL